MNDSDDIVHWLREQDEQGHHEAADEIEKLRGLLERVVFLFGESGWPRIEVMLRHVDGHKLYEDDDHRKVLPISDDDADRVRAARVYLDPTPQKVTATGIKGIDDSLQGPLSESLGSFFGDVGKVRKE